VVVNGCECEPYLTCDHRIMIEKTDQLLRGIRIALKATVQARDDRVEDNKLDAVQAIAAKLPPDGNISVHAVETKYPQAPRRC